MYEIIGKENYINTINKSLGGKIVLVYVYSGEQEKKIFKDATIYYLNINDRKNIDLKKTLHFVGFKKTPHMRVYTDGILRNILYNDKINID